MQKIDGVVGKDITSRLLRPPKNFRERGVPSVVEFLKFNADILLVDTEFIIRPRIVDCVASRSQPQAQDSFAERGIRHAVIRSQLDKEARFTLGDEPKSERDVAPPRARPSEEFRGPEQRFGTLRRQPINFEVPH